MSDKFKELTKPRVPTYRRNYTPSPPKIHMTAPPKTLTDALRTRKEVGLPVHIETTNKYNQARLSSSSKLRINVLNRILTFLKEVAKPQTAAQIADLCDCCSKTVMNRLKDNKDVIITPSVGCKPTLYQHRDTT